MKRKIILLTLAASTMFTMKSQVVLTENFTAPFSFGTPTSGWLFQNNSNPLGVTDWFQGNGVVFPAFNGGANDYIGANYNNTGSVTPGSISNWLVSPTVSLANGNIIEFATRTGNSIPDRLGLYISAGTGTNVGALGNATAVGSFTNLFTINAAISPSVYPDVWTIYTVAVTGVATPTVGRFAFRYDVTGAGFAGANSNYIGIDGVKYTLPCNQPTLAITQSAPGVCSGNTVSLNASTVGTVAPVSYTWSNGGGNASSAIVTPTTSIVYTLSATEAGGCVGTQTAAVSVTLTPNVSASSFTVCSSPATTVTLTATGATSYSWNTGPTTNSISVTPAVTTVYTVTGYAAAGSCPKNTTATVTIGNQLSVNIAASSNTICSGRNVTLTATSAGTTYSWTTGATTSTLVVSPSVTTTYSVGALSGTFPNVCVGGNSISINVIPSPTLSVAISPTTICSDGDFTVTASGAVTYTYILSSTSASTTNPLPLGAPNVSSLTVTGFTVGGSAANGCIAAGVVTLEINPNPTVTAAASAPTVCTGQTVSLTGSGADTYLWSGASSSAASPLTYSSSTAGNKSFTLTGTSLAGCTGTTAVSVNVVVCNVNLVGLNSNSANQETGVFPNPFSTEININALDGNVVIYNALGQIVVNLPVRSAETINTSELPKGAYILKAYNTSGELVKTVKLVKN